MLVPAVAYVLAVADVLFVASIPADPSFFILAGYFTYTVKKVNDFPVPSRDVTYQTLPGRE